MSSLFKRKASPYWYYTYGSGPGKIYRSTGTRDKKIARMIQKKWDEELILQKHGIYRKTTIALISEYKDHVTKRKSESWSRRIRQHLANWQEFIGDRPLEEVKLKDIDRYIDHRKKLSNKTVRDEVATISASFEYAILHEYTGVNPTKGVELPEKRAKVPRTAIPADIIEKALQNAPRDDDKIFWTIITYTGLRSGDAGTLQPDNISNGLITVRPEKTSKWQTTAQIPIHPRLEEIGIDNLYNVMPTRGSRNSSLQRFKRVVKQLGYSGRTDLHSLRHSFSTRLANMGLSPDMVRLVTGHTNTNQTLGYIHPSMETIGEYVRKL